MIVHPSKQEKPHPIVVEILELLDKAKKDAAGHESYIARIAQLSALNRLEKEIMEKVYTADVIVIEIMKMIAQARTTGLSNESYNALVTVEEQIRDKFTP